MKFTTVAMESLEQTSGQRVFIGYSNVSASVTLSADDPSSAHLFGFQQRAGDTNWFVCTKDSSTLSRVDTGVAVSTDVIKLIWYSDGAGTVLKWAIRSYANVDLGTGTLDTNLPGATTNMKFISGLEATEAAVKQIRHYRAREVTE